MKITNAAGGPFLPSKADLIDGIFKLGGKIGRRVYGFRMMLAITLIAVSISVIVRSSVTAMAGGSSAGIYAASLIAGLTLAAFSAYLTLATAMKRGRDMDIPGWGTALFVTALIGAGIYGATAHPELVGRIGRTIDVLAVVMFLFLLTMPGRKIEFPDTIFARQPESLEALDAQFESLPTSGGNSFYSFIYPDNTVAEYNPAQVADMKRDWQAVRQTQASGSQLAFTLMRRNAREERDRTGKNEHDLDMWMVRDNKVWKLTPEEVARIIS